MQAAYINATAVTFHGV